PMGGSEKRLCRRGKKRTCLPVFRFCCRVGLFLPGFLRDWDGIRLDRSGSENQCFGLCWSEAWGVRDLRRVHLRLDQAGSFYPKPGTQDCTLDDVGSQCGLVYGRLLCAYHGAAGLGGLLFGKAQFIRALLCIYGYRLLDLQKAVV